MRQWQAWRAEALPQGGEKRGRPGKGCLPSPLGFGPEQLWGEKRCQRQQCTGDSESRALTPLPQERGEAGEDVPGGGAVRDRGGVGAKQKEQRVP
eukprot:scaffold11989_cov112-Isochrysis_galbana.AAC.2